MQQEKEIQKINDKLDALKINIERALGDQNENIDSLRETVQGAAVNVDKVLHIVARLSDEYKPMIHQLNEHDKWIKELQNHPRKNPA